MGRQTTRMGGNTITLTGQQLQVGQTAPDFTVLDTGLMPVSLGDYRDSVRLISVVPSIDAGVCDEQTRRFDKLAAGAGDGSVVLSVSMDLPFALQRWSLAAAAESIVMLSDHRFASFGESYGVLIEELRLLNGAVFVLDEHDIIRYIEIIEENHNPPDFKRAIDAFESVGKLKRAQERS